MNNKRHIVLLAFAFGSTGAQATPYTMDDLYHGSKSNGYGDVIGAASDFQVAGANVTLNGSILTVDIFTNLAGKASSGLFANYTSNGKGIGFGDLFLSSSWDPYGSGPQYSADNAFNGTQWTYGFAMDDHWSDGSGAGTLYRLNGTNVENTILADELMLGNAVYRNGQEVLVDTVSTTVEDTGVDGTWVVTPTTAAAMGKVSYSFDIATTSLWDPTEPMRLALHWAMSCANDMIEGQTLLPPQPITTVAGITVPEPASLGLAMLGLAGAAWRRLAPAPRPARLSAAAAGARWDAGPRGRRFV